MKKISFVFYFSICFLFQSTCVHKEINIKEVYITQESEIIGKENLGTVKNIEKCTPRNSRVVSEEIRSNQDSNELFDLIEEAFYQSKHKKLLNVEINKIGISCTTLQGTYYEE